MGDSHVGLQARLMSQALRKLTAAISRSQTLVIFINQIRMKIGVMFGNPETTTGGNALKFYSSVRLDVRRIGAIKNGEDVVGNRTAVKVVKNKMAPPFAKAEFDLMYGEGFSLEGDIVDLGAQHNIIEKSGAWYSYNGERLGQGRDQAKTFLKEHKELAEQLRTKILELHKIGMIAPTVESGVTEDDGDDVEFAPAAAGKSAPAMSATTSATATAAVKSAVTASATAALPPKDALKKATEEKKTSAIPASKKN